MTAAAKRRKAERTGRMAEIVAAILLSAKGYRVLARRYRTRVGEIDMIVRRGRVIAFVEVKHRTRLESAAGAISATSQRRIAQAARHWLAAHPAWAEADLRFDAVLTAPWRWPSHIPAAFDAGPDP